MFYTTCVKIGAPNGPGVNEESFFEASATLQSIAFQAVYVTHHRDETPWARCIRKVRGFDWIYCQVRDFVAMILIRMKIASGDICIVRASVLPLGMLLGLFGTNRFIHLKTVGDIGFIEYRLREATRWHPMRLVNYSNLLLWRRLCAHAKVIDVCTPELKRLLVGYFGETVGDKIAVIPNGILSDRFIEHGANRCLKTLKEVVVGYVGGRPLKRGGREVIALVRALRDQGILAKGIIVGEDRQALEEYAAKTGVELHVRCTGIVSPDEVPQWMAQIDIGLALDEDDRHERVGNSYQKVAQYLASGCLVVTKKCSDSGLTGLAAVRDVNSSDVATLVATATELCSMDLEQIEEARSQACEFVKQYRDITALLCERVQIHVLLKETSGPV